MPQFDKQGREYAKLADLKAGDQLEADAGFTCMKQGEVYNVKSSPGIPQLHIICTETVHFLAGQDDGDGYLVGLYKVAAP